jgi:hypothetical protein
MPNTLHFKPPRGKRRRSGALLILSFLAALASGCQGDVTLPENNAGANTASSSNNGTSTTPVKEEAIEPAPGPAVVMRLTEAQYRNAMEDLFGTGLPSVALEPDTNPYLFFSIGAATTSVTSHGVEQYLDSALAITARVFDDPARREQLLGCAPESIEDPCVQVFITRFGQRVFRRPLSQEQITRWHDLGKEIAAISDVNTALESIVGAMLQSPRFLYRRIEGTQGPQGNRQYTSYEMAERLAFFLWNAPPDQVLLDAAANGELQDRASILTHAQRMVEDPKARAATQDFFAQYLDLERLEHVERDPARYPGFTPGTSAAMEMEVRLLVDDIIFRREGDIRTLFSSRRGYVNSELAALYGVDAPGASLVSFVPVEFSPESKRAGLLTLGAFLTMNAHPTETSPTLRGKYVLERLLCQTVPPPPDDIDLNLDPSDTEPKTLRERLIEHRENPACIGCHMLTDPPGFLFEHFDSVGVYREQVDGIAVDASGALLGANFANATEFAPALSSDPRLSHCMVRQLYRHAQGRLEENGEEPMLDAIDLEFAASGYSFKDLLVAVAASEGFRTYQPGATP